MPGYLGETLTLNSSDFFFFFLLTIPSSEAYALDQLMPLLRNLKNSPALASKSNSVMSLYLLKFYKALSLLSAGSEMLMSGGGCNIRPTSHHQRKIGNNSHSGGQTGKLVDKLDFKNFNIIPYEF